MSPGSSSRRRRGVPSDEASLREAFSHYDRDGSGSVNKGELVCILSDLGALDGLHPADAAAALDAAYRPSDDSRDGGVDVAALESFVTAVSRVPPRACPPREISPDFHAPGSLGASVRDAFLRQCTEKHPEEMTSARFLRVARTSGLVDDRLSLTVAAVVFAEARVPKTNRVAYDRFVAALAAIAALRDVPFRTVAAAVAAQTKRPNRTSGEGTSDEHANPRRDESTAPTNPPRDESAAPTNPRRSKKRWKGYASALDASDAAELVRRRVATNGVDRVSLKGCRLLDADAVRSVCDALRALRAEGVTEGVGGDGTEGDGTEGTRRVAEGTELAPRPSPPRLSPSSYPTTTLNLSSADVCGEGASFLASFLLDPLCALEELNLVDNPRVGVHLVETRVAAHATAHRADDPVADGGGCAALASALRSSACSLRRLNLGGCGVDDAGASALAAAVAAPNACPRLETLNLRSNDIGLAGASDVASAVERHGGALGDVSLANNARCSRDAVAELDAILARNRRARLADEMRRAVGGRADVRRRGLKDADAAAIAAALAPGAPGDGVVGLDASENAFTRVGVEALASALRGARGNRSLAHVTVRGNPGATYDRANDRAGLPTDAAQSLAGACAANFLAATGEGEALKSVADRGLGDAGAAEIAAAFANRFESFRRLRAVGTQHNGVGPAGAEALARAFGNLPRLDEWAAYSNRFGPEGAVAVARRMRVPGAFVTLRVLDLGGNGVGDVGCVAIAEAIVDHPAMEELHLDHNDVGVEGALALAGAMEATARDPFGGGEEEDREDREDRNTDAEMRHMDASTSSSMRDMDASTSSSASWWWRSRDGARGRRARVSLNPTPPPRARRPNPNANADARKRAPGLSRVWLHGNPRVPDDALAKIHALAFANAGDASRDVETIPSASAEDVARAEREDAEAAEAEARACRAKSARDDGVLSSAHFADRVAARAAAAYRRVLPNHSRDVRGAAVVAAVVAHENAGDEKAGDGPGAGDVLKVLSVGVGTKFVPPEVAAAAAAAGPAREGTYVRDSHAEVLARRGFRRFLLREMRELAEKAAGSDFASAGPRRVADGSSPPPWRLLEPVGAGGGFRARAGVTLHLYVSTAPCGGASAPSSAGIETLDAAAEISKPSANTRRDVDDVDVADTWRDVDARHAAGEFLGSAPRAMLKGTPSTNDASRGLAPGCVFAGRLRDVVGVAGKTLSCSDKIARWQMLGAQGALLSHLIPDPLAFDTIVVGRKFNPERIRAATCCRSRGFGHRLFGLGAGPKHCAALGASVKCEGAARAGAAIADRARADAGDGDESASWARGDARASVHDGRTGGPVGGGGPIPAVATEALWREFKALVTGPLRKRRDVADVPVAAVEARTVAEAKRLAARYAAAKHAMERGRAPEGSPLARWREGY